MPKTMENIDMLNVPIHGRQAKELTGQVVTIPAGDAGDVVNFTISPAPIANAGANFVGGAGDSSLTFNTGVFDTEVKFGKDDDDLAEGEFYLNYVTGEGRGKKATSGTSEDADFTVFAPLKPVSTPSAHTQDRERTLVSASTATEVAAANLDRKQGTVVVESTNTVAQKVYVKFGANASATSYDEILEAGDSLELDLDSEGNPYNGVITVFSTDTAVVNFSQR